MTQRALEDDMEPDSSVSGAKRKAAGMSGGAEADDGSTRKEAKVEVAAVAAAARPSTTIMSSSAADAFNEQYLRYFYANLFPFKQMFRWLSYGNDPDSLSDSPVLSRDFFHRREFCFTMADDVFIRYQCFRDATEFSKAVQAKQPYKIDIGPVMNVKPSLHAAVKKVEYLERELIFDIDMDAYDDIRHCCKGATICNRCWSFVNVAVKVIDTVLRNDFGFQHILFVYSGRRGMHCWVSDETARKLDNSQRAALVEYMAALNPGHGPAEGGAGTDGHSSKGGPSIAKTAAGLTVPLHPALVRAYADLEPIFETSIITEAGQGLLASPALWSRVLEAIPELPAGEGIPNLREIVEEGWNKPGNTPAKRWRQLKKTIFVAIDASGGSTAGPGNSVFGRLGAAFASGGDGAAKVGRFRLPWSTRLALERFIPAVVFTFTYPRLDIEVSKTMNHLLKAPFCIHPKTGRVCVPIDVSTVDSFDPRKVPTVATLVQEATVYSRSAAAGTAAGGAAAADADGDDAMDASAASGVTGATGKKADVWRHTSLRPYIEMFETFIRGCEVASVRDRRDVAASALTF